MPSQEVVNSIEGLESRCRIIVRDEKETWKDYAVFNTVTWIGEGGPRDPPPGWMLYHQLPESTKRFQRLALNGFMRITRPLILLFQFLRLTGVHILFLILYLI